MFMTVFLTFIYFVNIRARSCMCERGGYLCVCMCEVEGQLSSQHVSGGTNSSPRT